MAEAERHRNSRDFFFADIPLLYETSGETLCDRVVVVASSPNLQLQRLAQRKSLKNSDARKIINSQMPLEDKIQRADHVIWNNSDRETLMQQARKLVALWQDHLCKER
jgi:dephospho-CoA kinase